jgi:putative ABC transport system permease protein
MNFQFTLAFRYLMGRKLRTFLTTLAVVFGVMVIFGMNIVLPTMMQALQANTMAASGQVDVTVTHVTGDTFNISMVDKVKTIDGVKAISYSLNRTISLPANYFDKDIGKSDRINALGLIGIDPFFAKSVRSYPLHDGRFLNEEDDNAVMISQSLADILALKVGDSITIPSVNGSVALKIVGMLFPNLEPGNEQLIVTLSTAQKLMGQSGKINALDINLDSIEETRRNEIIANIKSKLGENYQVGALSGGEEIFGALNMGQMALNIFGVLALFMGAFIIFNTFRTVVVERRHDIGLLRAVGASRKMIRNVFLAEGLLQGIIGTLIGLVFGYIMGAFVIKVAEVPLSQFINLKLGAPVITVDILIISIALGIGVTVLAGLIPAVQASRLTPLEAIHISSAEVEFNRQSGWAFFVGLGLIIFAIVSLLSGNSTMISIGAIFILVGLVMVSPVLVRPIAKGFGKLLAIVYAHQGTGELAQGNLTRKPSRVAITSSATMLALAIVVAAGSIVSSLMISVNNMIRDGLGSDFLFIPPSISLWNNNVGSDKDFVDRLRNVDGVSMVSSMRYAGSMINDQAVSLMGIDPQNFPQISSLEFTEGDESAYKEIANGNNLIANGVFMNAMGAKLGDTVDLVTSNGKITFRITAVATDILNTKVTTAFISQENMARYFDRTEDVFIQLNLKPGVQIDSVESQIKAIAADYPQYNVVEGKEYFNSMLAFIKVAFSGMYVLLAILALPSLIAMLNTLAISVIERTREIGMLRAVGATKKQVRTMIVAEALLLAAVGTTFGILAGLYLGYVFVSGLSGMFPMDYAFPVAGLLAAIVIGLLFGILAALIPAKQAVQMDIVQALRYD